MVRALSITVFVLLVMLPLLAALPVLPFEHLTSVSAGFGDAGWPMTQTLLLTLISTFLVAWLGLAAARSVIQQRWFSSLSLILATPHVAFAVGLLFLFSPSGYLARLLEAALGVFPAPPQSWPLPEKSLVTLVLVLVIKELPFLLLMAATQLQQLPYQRWVSQAQSLGWSAARAWWLLVVPALLPRLKLPLAAIAVYTVSVVDIPLLLGPNAPGVLAMTTFEQHYQWGNDTQAALGVVALLFAGALVLALNAVAIRSYQRVAHSWRQQGRKSGRLALPDGFYSVLVMCVIGVSLLVLVALVLQSVAGGWFYPSLLPTQWQPQRWLSEWPYAQPLLWHSTWLAVGSGLLAVLAAVAVLERQRQRQQTGLSLLPLLLLLVPQLVLVLGWQRLLGQGSDGGLLLWSHTVFAFPYVYLVLHGAWTNYDERWLHQAQSLGYSYRQAWLKILLPMQAGPLAVAFAMGFSVSIAQYLPTLFLAGGTVPTLTTEAVSIASGGDWRLASLYALLQALLPLLVFSGVMLWSIKVHKQRTGA